jgi:monoamine oxidase
MSRRGLPPPAESAGVSRRTFAQGLVGAAAAGVLDTAIGSHAAQASAAPAAAVPPAARGGAVTDVLVIGAGLSGLESALQLEELGARVQVIEARQRIGGRVLTLFDRPGHPEAGGAGFGKGYGRILNRARSLELPLVDAGIRRAKFPKMELALESAVLSRDQWTSSPLNPLPQAMKPRMPWEFAGGFLSTNNPLPSSDAWLDAASAPLDVPLHQWLQSRGLDERTIRLCWSTNPYFGTSAYDISALQCFYNDAWTRTVSQGSTSSFAVEGGNQRLPLTMAKRLKGEVHLGREVVSIRDTGSDVDVRCRDGSRYRAKAVICSVPFGALRTMRFDPLLAGPQAEAVSTLPYMINTLFFFVPKRRYWEDDGLSPMMWTDGPAGVVVAERFGKTDDEVTSIIANPRGHVAAALDRLPPQEAIAIVRRAIEALRPAARGALDAGFVQAWAREPYSGGDWAVFAPGQVRRCASAMSAPAGRIHFCGEHTARANRGMEGAMESAERVALEVGALL